MISDLSGIVPIREFHRPDGRVTLFTERGRLLLDLEPQTVTFSPSPVIEAGQTVATGLSGLTIGGVSVETGPSGPLAGGRLAANFALRDSGSLEIQSQLDLLAADLIARFGTPLTDATLAPGLPGLFTDNGAALSGTPTPGLAGRVTVNALVDPDQGDEAWRVRDGLGAGAPGPVGDATQIGKLMSALGRPVASAPGSAAQSLATMLAEIGTRISTARNTAEDAAARDGARFADLTERVMENGVDTDAEMQRLITIEQTYAANARVIETADLMLKRLLEI